MKQMNDWYDTWDTIDWQHESDERLLKKVKELIEHGADVNAQDYDDNKTALHLAVKYNRIDVIKLLIENG